MCCLLSVATRVAFEIDDIDEERESGWSVLVLGSAERVTREYTLTSLWKDGPVPWAEGTRNLFIMITPKRSPDGWWGRLPRIERTRALARGWSIRIAVSQGTTPARRS